VTETAIRPSRSTPTLATSVFQLIFTGYGAPSRATMNARLVVPARPQTLTSTPIETARVRIRTEVRPAGSVPELAIPQTPRAAWVYHIGSDWHILYTMATWEDPNGEPGPAGRARNLSAATAAALILSLSGVGLAASRLPIVRQADFFAQRVTPSNPRVASVPLRPDPQFVVIFGAFASRAQADAYARTIRSKGYLATVLQDVTSFRVVSRPYQSQERADFWRGVFEEIGLDAGTTAEVPPGS